MRMTIMLAAACSFLISCSTLELLSPKQETAANPEQPVISPEPTASASLTNGTESDMGDGSQVQSETQAAEQQQEQTHVANEQRSNSELDSAAPEVPATDTFYAGTQAKTETPTPELFPATLPEKQPVTSNHEEYSRSSAGTTEEKAVSQKSSKQKSSKHLAKKHSKKSIAKKNSKKSHHIAKKQSSKKHKAMAKKSSIKMDCKKIAKHSKKASKKEIAMCKSEKRKVASKSKRVSKISSHVKRI